MGVSIETLKRAERKGELRPIKFNARLLRYDIADIARWFCESTPNAGGEDCPRVRAMIARWEKRMVTQAAKEQTPNHD